MKRMISLILTVVLLLGSLSALAVAVESDEMIFETGKIQQLTKPIYSYEQMYCVGDYAVSYHSDPAMQGLMDPYGNSILSPIYNYILVLNEDIVKAKLYGTDLAVFYRGKQITDFCYLDVNIRRSRVVCERNSGGFDFFDLKMNRLSVPKTLGKWEIYDCLAEEHYLGRYRQSENHAYEYALLDKNGNNVYAYGRPSQLYAFSDYLAGVWGNLGSSVTWKGNRPINDHCNVNEASPEGDSYIVYSTNHANGSTVDAFYIVDEKMNLIFDGTKCSEDVIPGTVHYMNNDLVYGQRSQGGYVVMDLHGTILKEVDADSLSLLGSDYNSKIISFFGFIGMKGEEARIYNKACEEVLALKDLKSISAQGYDFLAQFTDGTKTLYDKAGNKLFDLEDRNYVFSDGVILVKENGKYALCNRKGEPVTDFSFKNVLSTRKYGICNLLHSETGLFYLADGLGQLLNADGYASMVSFDSYNDLAIYTSSDYKHGVLRYVGIDDPTFMDAPKKSWYYEAVEYCAENGLFSGTAAGRFSPDNTMTRAMLVTVLWRLDGEQSPSNKAEFTDVMDGNWYTDAVAWASENGIVNGVGKGRFNPDGNVTREQIATILRRYADYKGLDTSKTADLSSFPDHSQISAYAREAMSWANAEGLINGNQSAGKLILQPTGNATRAQVATILMRYVEKLS